MLLTKGILILKELFTLGFSFQLNHWGWGGGSFSPLPSSGVFFLLQSIWYINGVKVVPKNIYDLLTPISLAYWIMDDGGKSGNGFHFATNAFSVEDVNLLVKVLHGKFGLKCSIHSRNRIYIWASSSLQLANIVRPYVHNSMAYKIA